MAFPGILILGGRRRTRRSLLAWPPTIRRRAFVLPLLLRVAPPGRPSNATVQPLRTCSFPRLFRFPCFLSSVPFLPGPDSRGKVALPSLPKSSASLGGGRWERGVCWKRDRSSELWRVSALPCAAWLIAAASDGPIAGAEPRSPPLAQEAYPAPPRRAKKEREPHA